MYAVSLSPRSLIRVRLLLCIVTAALLLGVVAFCVFGFLATFEPMPPVRQWMWRAIYSGIGSTAVVGAAFIFRR